MFWKYSQSKLKTRAGIPDLYSTDINGKTTQIKDDIGKANHFQEYFGGVFTNEPDGDMPEFDERQYDSVLSSIQITEEIVLKKLNKLKVYKSPGQDTLHPRVLREISIELCKPLQIIFQTSLEQKKTPKRLETCPSHSDIQKRCQN